jgi:RNA polymerase sigma-70 factor (ECF subfamily)
MSIVVAAAARATELCGLRPYLMRVALSRMRDRDAAEDVVQETLAAACAGVAAFGRRSSLRTWVTGILLHKVTDAFRSHARQPVDLAAATGDLDEAPDFADDGRWRAPVTEWSDPETALDCRRFRETFEALLAKLPPRQARAYTMRELQGLEPAEVCAALQVSEANLHVLLHRARLALRAGLDRQWFERDAA